MNEAKEKTMKRYEDASDMLNSAKYHTGKPCIEPGCARPAGTRWSRYWCQTCNSARMTRIGAALEHEVARMEGRVPKNSMTPNA